MEIIVGHGRKFLLAWLTNFVAACGLARSTAVYNGLQWWLWGLFTLREHHSVQRY